MAGDFIIFADLQLIQFAAVLTILRVRVLLSVSFASACRRPLSYAFRPPNWTGYVRCVAGIVNMPPEVCNNYTFLRPPELSNLNLNAFVRVISVIIHVGNAKPKRIGFADVSWPWDKLI